MAGQTVTTAAEQGKPARTTIHLSEAQTGQVEELLAKAFEPLSFLVSILSDSDMTKTQPKTDLWMIGELLEFLEETCIKRFLHDLQEKGIANQPNFPPRG